MKVYLINLDGETERLAVADAQLKRLGVEYERVSAVRGSGLTKQERNASVNRFRWWCAVGRPIRIGEIGCAMSHYAIYRQMQQDHLKAACVLEDDVILDGRFNEVLEFVERNIVITRPQIFLLSNHTQVVDNKKDCHIVACKRDMYAEGYVITASAARALLGANLPMQTPCDWWGRWSRRGIIELYHVFPTVCHQDQSQYASGTVDPNSFDVKNLSLLRFCLHKFLRLIGKIFDIILPA